MKVSHNPYFNRWFSAIFVKNNSNIKYKFVTILILIDGFLQYNYESRKKGTLQQSQSLF